MLLENAARTQRGLRRALFAVRLCRVDFLCVSCDCLVSVAQKRAESFPAVPRFGLSLDAAHLFRRRGRPHCELVDGPASALLVGSGSDPGGIPFFYRWHKSPRAPAAACEHS